MSPTEESWEVLEISLVVKILKSTSSEHNQPQTSRIGAFRPHNSLVQQLWVSFVALSGMYTESWK